MINRYSYLLLGALLLSCDEIHFRMVDTFGFPASGCHEVWHFCALENGSGLDRPDAMRECE